MAVALGVLVASALAGLLVLDLGTSLIFGGMFGRHNSDLVEHFPGPVMVQVFASVGAAVSSAVFGLRAVRRGVGWPAAKRHLGLTAVITGVLGYGLWLAPGAGMWVQGLDHPVVGVLNREFSWIHDTADYVPVVEAKVRGWELEEVTTERVEGALQIEARARRGPLTSTVRFSIPVVAEVGDERLPLEVGRRWRYEEVALASGDVPEVVPWAQESSPRELVIEVVGERWVSGRHWFDVRRTIGDDRELLEVYASDGRWWVDVAGRFRDFSLVERWIGECDGAVCRFGRHRGWRLREGT